LTASDLSALKAALNVEELSDEDLEKVAGGGNASAIVTGVDTAVGSALTATSVVIGTAAAAAAIF